jgi:uroporphyrinogen-III decarboxylase
MSLLTFDPHSQRIELAHRRLAAADNDWLPFIDTMCGVVFDAQAFGCEVVYGEGGVAWTRPATCDISQVWSLKPMKHEEAPLIRRLSEWVDYAQRKFGTEVPMWTMDLQSPFSIAAHIVEPTELLTACITDPKAVHHLCQMVTEFSIEMMRRHLAQLEHPGFPGRNFPSISDSIGICIADDTPLIMLSPEMYREFALPYNSRIGQEFGGVHVHSCGDYRHSLDNVLEITNVRSIQVHAGPGEFPLPESPDEDCPFNRARKRVTCFVDTNSVCRADEYENRPREHYAEYVVPRLRPTRTTGIILQSCGTGEGVPDAEAALRWTRSQLA